MRLGSPQTGSCSARWRSCVSPAAIACVGPPRVAHHQAAEQRETGDRHGDEWQHACRDLAAGLGSLATPGGRSGCLAGRRWRSHAASPAWRRIVGHDMQAGQVAADRRSRCSNSSSIYLTEMTIGAAALPAARSLSEPTATAATIAGLSMHRSIQPVERPGLRGSVRGDHGAVRLPARRRAGRASKSRIASASAGGSGDRSDIAGGTRARVFDLIGTVDDHDQVVIEDRSSSQLPRRRSDPLRIVADRGSPAWRRSVAATLSTSRNTRAPRSAIAAGSVAARA